MTQDCKHTSNIYEYLDKWWQIVLDQLLHIPIEIVLSSTRINPNQPPINGQSSPSSWPFDRPGAHQPGLPVVSSVRNSKGAHAAVRGGASPTASTWIMGLTDGWWPMKVHIGSYWLIVVNHAPLETPWPADHNSGERDAAWCCLKMMNFGEGWTMVNGLSNNH